MGVETALAGASVIGGLYDSYSYADQARKMKKNFNNYLADFDRQTENTVNQARQALSTNTASQIAQVSQAAAARGSQSGVSGANTEAIISQAAQPIYENQTKENQNILNFIASAHSKRAEMIYNFNAQKAQMDAGSPNPLGSMLGIFQTGLNIYNGYRTAFPKNDDKKDFGYNNNSFDVNMENAGLLDFEQHFKGFI